MRTTDALKRLRGLLLMACVGILVPAAAREPDGARGMLREGVWVLNTARSHELQPGRQTLWIVRDDGVDLVWVAVRVDPEGEVHLASWAGRYDGQPVPVTGTPMTTRLRPTGRATFENSGEIAGVGPYSEACRVLAQGRRFTCRGTVQTSQGAQEWLDDFDWVAPSPAAAARRTRGVAH